MAIPAIIAGLLPLLGTLVDRAIPDKAQAEKAKQELTQQLLAAVTAQDAAQSATNTAEAANPSLFIAGWRPAIGWVCAAAFGWTFVGHDLAVWMVGPERVPPLTGTDALLELTLAMLGLGALRTWEKLKGVTK